jgi:hypothetical protein
LALSLSVSLRFVFESWRLGASPKKMPASSESRSVKTNTCGSMPISLKCGRLSGLMARMARTPQ